MIFTMNLSVSFSPSQFTQSSLDSLLETGVKEFYIPYFTPYWVSIFGTYLQPTATPEFQCCSSDVYVEMLNQIHSAGGEVVAVLDGELTSEKELEWFEQALTFLDANGVKQACISNPSIPVLFSEKFPHTSWVASHHTRVYSTPAAAFWADLGIYRIILPYQLTGAEALAVIHYSSHLPVKFTLPILGTSHHQLDGACHSDCDWVGPMMCREPLQHWLEPDMTQDAAFIHRLMSDPNAEGQWSTIPPEQRYKFTKKLNEQYAVNAAFSPSMPLKCGACFLPQIKEIPSLNCHIHAVRLDPPRVIQEIRRIQNALQPGSTQTQIQDELKQPAICSSRQWCLYPDQVGKHV